MLVLTRKVNEEILIGDNIRIKVVDIGAGRIRLGISAPRDVTVLRDEVIRDFDVPAIETAPSTTTPSAKAGLKTAVASKAVPASKLSADLCEKSAETCGAV